VAGNKFKVIIISIIAMYSYNNIQIRWLGHDSFKISHNNSHIYIDPYRIDRATNDANFLLISHNHYDHLSIEDIQKVINRNTIIIAPEECSDGLKDISSNEIRKVRPSDEITLEQYKIEVVEAYNVNKNYHPKDDKKVGFIITICNTRIYHAGDTDLIPEMKIFGPDIALVPVSGTYVMTAEEAALAVNDYLKPKVTIPMHYNSIVGGIEDAKKFRELVKNAEVIILENEYS
jgi:L-ascorbate metabolism protein UlaG (beta-lactamase superfamily)